MKITHPVKGYDGHVRVGDAGFDFLAGVAHRKAKDIPDRVREQMDAEGFTFTDPRRQIDDQEGDAPAGDAA